MSGVRVGQSYPFAPPVGLMFVLWDDDALRDWLAKEPTIPLRTDTRPDEPRRRRMPQPTATSSSA